MEKSCIILRGCPGSGKSSLAESLATGLDSVICEADKFLYNEAGEYEWTEERVYIAHKKCEELFHESLVKGKERIIVSNTNVYTKDVKSYRELALEYGYKVFVMVIENYHGGTNSHDVPEDRLDKMVNAIKSNIKLR